MTRAILLAAVLGAGVFGAFDGVEPGRCGGSSVGALGS